LGKDEREGKRIGEGKGEGEREKKRVRG